MAARNPSSFDFSYDEYELSAGQYVKAAIPDTILDNQQYCLDRPQLILCDMWVAAAVSTTAGDQVWRRHWCLFDLCGVTSTQNVYVAFCANGVAAAPGTFTVGAKFNNVSGGPNTITATFNCNTTTPVWSSIVGPVAMKSEGIEEIHIYTNNAGAVAGLTTHGIAIWSAER